MSQRPVDWSPLAGSDPVPGEPDRVEELGRHYQRVASAISDAATKLRQIAERQDMQSKAVDAFRGTAREVADDISRAHERYDGVGRALIGYAPELRDAQSESVAALAQAQEAEKAQATANQLAHGAQSRINAAADGADTTADQGAHRRALTAADTAGDDLTAARRRLNRATDARDTAAQRAMRLVADVKDSGDLKDSWWDRWGAKIVKMIVKIADIVAVVAGLLALVVGWIPVIGGPLAAALITVALVASVVSLLGNIVLAATGDGEWSDVAWAAIGVLSFGVGRAAIGGLRVSALGVRGASRLAAGRLAARSVLERAAAGLPRSSSSMAAIRSMLGTANPMTRSAARAAARRSLEQGFVPSASSIGHSLRAMPGEFADNIRTLLHADWRDALRQARQDGWPHLMRFLGEHGADADLQDIKKIHSVVQASDEVTPHLGQLKTQQGVFYSTAGYNVYDIGRTAAGLAPPPTAAQELHLPNAQQPVGAGARP
ncbi:MAG: putative T7SS-secreted protein [Pseudonocardiaceae bacterium]